MTNSEAAASIREVLKAVFLRGTRPDMSALPPPDRERAGLVWALLTDAPEAELSVPRLAIEAAPRGLGEITELRWRALLSWHQGDFAAASDYLGRAIALSSADAPMGWAKRDLEEDQLDCAIARANSGDREGTQGLLSSLDSDRRSSPSGEYFRGLSSAFRRTLESEIEELHRSPHTIVFGGSLESALDSIAESLEVALSLASIVLLSSARVALGHILYQYGRSYKAPDLVISALVLYLLERDTKRVEGILKSDWQLLFPALSRSPLRFVDEMAPRHDPLDVAARCAVLAALGGYVTPERAGDLQDFVLAALDLDAERGFGSVAGRGALQGLPAFVDLLDPDAVLPRLERLLAGHPVVVSEVLRVLEHVNWGRSLKDLAEQVARRVFELRGKAMPGPGPFHALRMIARAWPGATKPLEDELLREWEKDGKDAAVLYFADAPGNLPECVRRVFATRLLDQLERENDEAKSDHLHVGAYSKWYLLSEYLALEQAAILVHALEVAVRTVLNPNQGGHIKRECMDVILWMYDRYPSKRTLIVDHFVLPVLAEPHLATSCRSDDFLLRYSRERLQLRLDEVWILHEAPDYEQIVQDCVRLGMHPFVDVRGDTIRILSRLVDVRPLGTNRELACLLLSRTYDEWPWNAGDAVTALSRWVARNAAWENVLDSRCSDLLEHGSTYVRSCVSSAAAFMVQNGRDRKRFASLLERGERDLHYAVRRHARELASKPPTDP